MTAFRNRGIEVVVDTTKPAEFDFATHRISNEDQERVANDLRRILHSERDRSQGYLRIREIVEGWDVVFTHYVDGPTYVILIVGYGRRGEMETTLSLLARAGVEQLTPGVRVLLEGRKRG